MDNNLHVLRESMYTVERPIERKQAIFKGVPVRLGPTIWRGRSNIAVGTAPHSNTSITDQNMGNNTSQILAMRALVEWGDYLGLLRGSPWDR